MSKCTYCKRKTTISNAINCKWCENSYCIGCLSIETHQCSRMKECKQAALHDLNNKLESGKMNSKQIKL